MDKKKIYLILLVVIGLFIMISNFKQKKLSGGDSNSHLYRSKACVQQILDDKNIKVHISQETDTADMFESDELLLSSASAFTGIKENDNIEFFFFKYNIEQNRINIHKFRIIK